MSARALICWLILAACVIGVLAFIGSFGLPNLPQMVWWRSLTFYGILSLGCASGMASYAVARFWDAWPENRQTIFLWLFARSFLSVFLTGLVPDIIAFSMQETNRYANNWRLVILVILFAWAPVKRFFAGRE